MIFSTMTSWWMILNDSRDFNSSWKEDVQSSDSITKKLDWYHLEVHHSFLRFGVLKVKGHLRSKRSVSSWKWYSLWIWVSTYLIFSTKVMRARKSNRRFFLRKILLKWYFIIFYNFEIISDIIIEVSVLNFVLSPVPNPPQHSFRPFLMISTHPLK